MRAARGDVQRMVVVDEGVMTHVFHAYATYRVPFKRGATVLVNKIPEQPSLSGSAPPSQQAPAEAQAGDVDPPSGVPQPPVARRNSNFPILLPQTHQEVLAEANALFARITSRSENPAENTPGSTSQTFEHVLLTPRLLNAYLSVQYSHASFDEGSRLYNEVFGAHGVARNAWSYVEALERAARADRWSRKQALEFARGVWEEWRGVETAWRRGAEGAPGLSARLVERAYVAMIRVLSL